MCSISTGDCVVYESGWPAAEIAEKSDTLGAQVIYLELAVTIRNSACLFFFSYRMSFKRASGWKIYREWVLVPFLL